MFPIGIFSSIIFHGIKDIVKYGSVKITPNDIRKLNQELDPRLTELKNDRGDASGKDEGDKKI